MFASRSRARLRQLCSHAGLLASAALAGTACQDSPNPQANGTSDARPDSRVHVEDSFVPTDFQLPQDGGRADVWVPDFGTAFDQFIPPIPDGAVVSKDGGVPADGATDGPNAADGRTDGPPVADAFIPVPTDGAAPDLTPVCIPEDERCDGLDNDCDGQVDEDFHIGEPCDGVGACGPGRFECADEQTARCSSEPEGTADQSSPERCDQLDNNCDGETDENPELLSQGCYSGPAGTSGVGICHPGSRACLDGALEAGCPGEVTPALEVCDGVDNDCNGRVDENIAVERQCGTGVCRASSTPGACMGGQLLACVPGPATGDDSVCNNLDDDCDGSVDEAYVPIEHCGVGRCGALAIPSRCLGGVEQPCRPAPALANDANCNAVDDDCDGQTDEDYHGVQVCGVGVCASSSQPANCTHGVETPCQPGPTTGDDTDCDGTDDNCNGTADENYIRQGGCGTGVCAVTETPSRCVAGHETPCQPGLPFSVADATCDGLDDNCNGRVDEDYVSLGGCGVGFCAVTATPSTCGGGIETACVPGRPRAATDTTCDGVDDDCDGTLDEDAVVLAGAGERRLTNTAFDAVRPQAASNGNGYGVVFSDARSGRNIIYLDKLNPAGDLVGNEIVVTNLAGSNGTPSVAFGGNRYAVVWQGTANARPQIFLSIRDVDGAAVVGAQDVPVNVSFDTASAPRVIWNGTQFVVFWQMGADLPSQEIYSRAFTTAGVAVAAEVNVSHTAASSGSPAIAYNAVANELAVVWAENEGADGGFNVYFTRTNATGSPIGSLERVTHGPGNESQPAIAFDGNAYGVVWQDTRDTQDIWFVRVSAAGLTLPGETVLVPAALLSSAPSIAWDGTHFGVAWFDRRANNNDEIYFARVTPPGTVSLAYRLSNAAGTSFLPWLVWGGSDFGVVWYDNRDGPQQIYFAHGPFGCP